MNIQFSKYHIWKREEFTNTNTHNIFGFADVSYLLNSGLYACKFLTETKEIQSLYLSKVLQSTELG